jgi:HSP20 family protein
MLVATDPFRDFDRLAQQVWGTTTRPAAMPMDAWRDGEQIVVQFDLPGVDMYSVDLDVRRNVLTVRAGRRPSKRRPSTGKDTEMIAAERPRGVLRRQLILGDTPDTDRVQAATAPMSSRCASRSPKRPHRARSPTRSRTPAALR